MSDVKVSLVPIGDDRFGVVLKGAQVPPHLGPVGGNAVGGYTENDVKQYLQESLGLSSTSIETLIAVSEARRASGG